jgi:type II secretory pathway pseudopilin PulG
LSRKPRGVSLLEALVATLLLGLVAAMVASLARNYGQVISFNRGKSQTAQAQRAIETLCQESARALSVASPDGPNLTDNVQFEIVDTFSENRFKAGYEWDEDYMNGRDWGVFDPRRSTDLLKVNYELSGDALLKAISDGQGNTTTNTVAEGLIGFSATNPEPRLLRFEVSVQEARRVVTFTGMTYRWLD